jgi:hypothetical protein
MAAVLKVEGLVTCLEMPIRLLVEYGPVAIDFIQA